MARWGMLTPDPGFATGVLKLGWFSREMWERLETLLVVTTQGGREKEAASGTKDQRCCKQATIQRTASPQQGALQSQRQQRQAERCFPINPSPAAISETLTILSEIDICHPSDRAVILSHKSTCPLCVCVCVCVLSCSVVSNSLQPHGL